MSSAVFWGIKMTVFLAMLEYGIWLENMDRVSHNFTILVASVLQHHDKHQTHTNDIFLGICHGTILLLSLYLGS